MMEQNYLDDNSLINQQLSGSSGNYIDNKKTTVTGTNGSNSITIGSTTITTTNNNTNNSINNNQIVMELCLVCGDRASGRHYGAISCEGCKGFFKRSIRKQLGYQCRGSMNCEVTKHHRNRCQFCRLQKCLASGMRSDSVQHERKPILDKKEFMKQQQSSSNGHNLSTNSSLSTNPINLNSNNGSGFLYHQRQQQAQQIKNEFSSFSSGNYTIGNTNNNNSSNDNNNSITNYQLTANLNAFSPGFNFTDLTQTLNKRALLAAAAVSSAPYASISSETNSNNNNKINNYSPPTISQSLIINDDDEDDDDDSLDNSIISNKNGLLMGQNLSINNTNSQQNKNHNNNLSRTEAYLSNQNNNNNQYKNYNNLSISGSATSSLIQKHIDQNIITQSMELLEYLQKQYNDNSNTKKSEITSSASPPPSSSITRNNNNNINNNLLKLNDSINFINNTIVKNELIIDDTEQQLNNSDQDDDTIDEDIIADNDKNSNKNKFILNNNLSPKQLISSETINKNDNNNASSSTTTSPINNIDIDMSVIIDKNNIEFKLQPPNLVPSYLNSHYVCETGSRILFLSVYWLKNIKIFQKLNDNIQIIILRRHWVKLFAIGLAQCSKILSIPIIIQTITNNIIQLTNDDNNHNNNCNNNDDEQQQKCHNQQNKKFNDTTTTATNLIPKILYKFEENIKINKIKKLTEHITNLNEFICIMESLNIDDYEYAFIRLICSFSPDNLNCKDLNNRQIINKMQELILSNFKLYLFEKYDKLYNNCNVSNDNHHNNNLLQQQIDERCNKILLRLMQLSALQSDIIEELFFTNLIGHVQIENMIPLILKLGGKGI